MGQLGVIGKQPRHNPHSDYFATDTSEVEDLIDSEGILSVPNSAASSIAGSEILTTQDEGVFGIPGLSNEPQPSTSYAAPKIPQELSTNGRAV